MPLRRAMAAVLAAGMLMAGIPALAIGAGAGEGAGEILIRTLQGKAITLNVNDGDSIGAVKDKIRDIEGIPVDQQQLVFNGKQLTDGAPVPTAAVAPAGQQARENGRPLEAADAAFRPGPRIVLQTIDEARSPQHVRGAFDVAASRTASIAAIASAGGLPLSHRSRVEMRITGNGCGARVRGATVTAARVGACRVVVSVSRASGATRRAPVLLTAG